MIARGRMTATAGQSPRQIGRLAAEQAYRFLAGEPVQKEIRLPTRLWTSGNIDESNREGWD